MRTTLLFALLLALAALSGAATAQTKLDGIAAVVGDEIILESDVNTMLSQYAFQNKVNVFNDPQLRGRLQREFLNRMIDEKVLLVKADEDTITADEDRVDQLLDQQLSSFLQQAGSVEALESYYGMPMVKIRKEMREQIANRMRVDMLRQQRFANIKVSRREVENFFQQYRDSLPRVEETVDISHVLMQVRPSATATEAALARIRDLRERVAAGEDFETLARAESDDPSAKANGGDLGFVSRGDLVTEFEEVAFGLEIGELSDIVQTQFGFHFMELLDRQGEKIRVRHILVRLQPTPEDEERVVQRLKEIRASVLAGDATFEEMALANSDDPNVRDDKGRLGEFAAGEFQVKAFGEAVKDLQPGEISEPFRTDFGYHILLLHSRTAPRTYTLEDDWQRIEQYAIDFKRNREFDEWLAQIRSEIPVEVKLKI